MQEVIKGRNGATTRNMAQYITSQFSRALSRYAAQPGKRPKKCAGWQRKAHETDFVLVTVHFMDHRIRKFCPACIQDVFADESLSPEDRRIVETARELSAIFNRSA
jgi:hypothetical protein